MTATALAYPTSQINRDFRIKVNGLTEDGKKVNVLVGVSGLIRFFGVEFANKFLTRAYNDINHDNTTCKLRRGIKVTFYSK